jgi:hypothetical protein
MAVYARYHFRDNNNSVAYTQLRLSDRVIAIGNVVGLLSALSNAQLFKVEIREPIPVSYGQPSGTYTLAEVVYRVDYYYRVVRLPISNDIYSPYFLDYRPEDDELWDLWTLLDDIGAAIYGVPATALVF